ncbi:beta galactosidase jelly roll domain-containing protein [Methylobacillus arboreus]|uniref:glycoside hydrolase family 2 protein n=1 Tax=Methylobacillus arboreus TaxID=755170 RepID=UPI001E308471|nr:sugar-binding domain-containing protein [Methylobacillus arboreus]MCB5190984.1 beta galactosidase jelly roll domain-containing protein [Methylobacillus arboreus]
MQFIPRLITLLLLSLTLGALPLHAKSIDHQSLNGRWQFQPIKGSVSITPQLQAPAQGWKTIAVPDNWYRQGHDINGLAWYKTQFKVDAKAAPRVAHLVFNGVDYEADIWLNDHYLGHHTGYFQTFEFDVTGLLKQGENQLRVLVNSPLEKPEDWSLHKRLIKGIFSHHDTRPGGAWSERGQEKNTGGIWAPVELQFADQAALRHLQVTPRKQATKASPQHWQINTAADIQHHVSHETPVTVEARISPENFQGPSFNFKQQQTLKPGSNRLALNFPLDKPALWWPAEHGKPNLYKLELSLRDAQGKLLDQQHQVFGVREVKVDDGLRWYINGRRMFVRGTNYIGSQWLAEMTPARYQQDLKMMQAANINAVRVHAHITGRAFYELCDRMGILVTQDFPLLWGYSDDPAFIAEARSQAKNMVQSLQQHPSIISWTMHNEPPWDSPWMAEKYPDYQPGINRKLDELLYEDVSKLDPLRVVRKESASKEHEWMGWYFDHWLAFSRPTPTPWSTEFGAQALPNLKSLKRMFSDDLLWPDTEAKWREWEYHNFQRKETFEFAKVPQGRNIEEFIANSQHYQARLIQFAVENYRRQRYAPVSAVFQFMFVENWPSINWGIVDYWREPKAGYDALRTAYQPILPSLEWKQDEYHAGDTPNIGLWAINDTWRGFEHASYTVTLHRDGKLLDTLKLPLEMLPDSGHKLRDYPLPALEPGQYELKAEIAGQDGKLMGRNSYRFQVK